MSTDHNDYTGALDYAHFEVLPFTLLQEFFQDRKADEVSVGPPRRLMPERELVVYAGSYFALRRPSELIEIDFDNLAA